EERGFPDNWIYINDASVAVGRIQNFGRWSPYLVKDGRTCLGLEYFVNEGDDMWTKADPDLIEQGKRELCEIGLLDDPSQVETGYVVRMPKAYPMYDDTYKANVETMRKWLDANAPNVFPVGRNGMHKYNNQDHSMYTAMLSVENIFGANNDVWNVNVETEYHEEKSAGDAGGKGCCYPLQRRHRRPNRSRIPHHVTSSNSSAKMNHVILEWPRTRSVNTIGTSTIRPPHRWTRYAVSI